jgi:hypothetical protein
MPVPSGTYQTYQSIGNREDLIDVITNISPIDTWFTSNTGSVRAKARVHEFQTDVLAAAAANAVIEGDDATTTAIVPTVRLQNSTQILRKVYRVSDTQEVIDKAGRGSEIAYQTVKNMKVLAKDIEFALIINAAEVVGTASVARELKGVLGFITTNSLTSGSPRILTETLLNDNLSDIWAQGGVPATVLCGQFQKRTISAFTTNTRNVSADEKKLTAAVDIYQSDFGTIHVRLHHQMNTSQAGSLIVLGDMDNWKKAWLRPIKREELARTGSSRQFMIEAELTLEGRAENGHGEILNLTTA